MATRSFFHFSMGLEVKTQHIFVICFFALHPFYSAAKCEESITDISLFASQPVVSDSDWREVTSEDKWQIVNMIAHHTQSNYHRIKTWNGMYRVRASERRLESSLGGIVDKELPSRDLSNVAIEFSFSLRFAIDIPGKHIYREKKTDQFYWFDRNSKERFSIPDTGPVDERSYVSGGEYVRFNPEIIWPESSYLVGNPDAQMKRAAVKESAEHGQRKHFSDLLDPSEFYGHRQGSKFWELLLSFVDVHNGKRGEEKKEFIEKTLKLFESNVDGKQMYRLDGGIRGRDGKPIEYLTSWVFDGGVGFHPSSLVISNLSGVKSQEIRWKWKSLEGIYVPEAVHEHYFPSDVQTMDLWRESELSECELNKPFPDSQFTLRGLGLGEGELLIDKVDRAVFILRNGEPERLGSFGDRYEPSVQQETPSYLLLIGLSIPIVALFVIALLRRR